VDKPSTGPTTFCLYAHRSGEIFLLRKVNFLGSYTVDITSWLKENRSLFSYSSIMFIYVDEYTKRFVVRACKIGDFRGME
jgi:hypothetical protein